ncbi:MAG: DUF4097 domain-containing protein [Clostridiales Family XIII bacterium]|jgi:hypothetical protein|nr:DUF4097 domain-containing protein [Clostridiales Family XIII bacterium]
MNRGVKGLAAFSAALLIIGLVFLMAGAAVGGMNPIAFGEDGFEIAFEGLKGDGGAFSRDFDDFDSIDADLGAYGYDVVLDEGDGFSVVGDFDPRFGPPEISVEDGRLVIRDRHGDRGEGRRSGGWMNLVLSGGGAFGWADYLDRYPRTVTVTYPKGKLFDSVSVRGAAARVTLRGLNAKTLEVSCGAGDLRYEGGDAGEVDVRLSFGNCRVVGVSCGEARFSLNMGALSASRFDCGGLRAEVNMGETDVSGALRGDVRVSAKMGAVAVRTSLPKNEYSYSVRTGMGEASVDGEGVPAGREDVKNAEADNHIEIRASMGSAKLNFGG